MAVQVVTDVVGLIWQHPGFSCLVLLLFTPPFFPIVRFFSPLLVSTALFMLALFTMGPASRSSEYPEGEEKEEEEENWEFRRTADVKVWEDKSVEGASGRRSRKGKGADHGIMDWLSGVHEAGLVWVETKFRNENWKGSALNDDNVSILQEASWATSTSGGSSSRPVAEEEKVVESIKVLEEKPSKGLEEKPSKGLEEKPSKGLEEKPSKGLEEKPSKGLEEKPSKVETLKHEPLVHLQVPTKLGATAIEESPSTDLDSSSSDLERSRRRLLFSTVRRNSTNASSGLSESDIDTPTAVVMAQSKSGKLKQMETLGDFIEESSTSHHSSPAHELAILQPTTADQVDAVKDKLHDFTRRTESVEVELATVTTSQLAPGSPLFKGSARKKVTVSDATGSSSGDEQFSDSDSDSDEFEIFPPVDPTKMKLHPPVKLDIQQLEKKLGTSLSKPKSEISEVH